MNKAMYNGYSLAMWWKLKIFSPLLLANIVSKDKDKNYSRLFSSVGADTH
jgi:hypothetical protein